MNVRQIGRITVDKLQAESITSKFKKQVDSHSSRWEQREYGRSPRSQDYLHQKKDVLNN
ncbi:MAG: hypothetical protein V7L29_15410 [Nostoc sp.]|uniref:hypothetical protein n=1 Tax=Nostoc sp. TaxID=1180 RepID=UPI002FF9B503